MLMRVNIRCRICLQQATVVNYFAQMLSFGRIRRSCSVLPTVPVHFMNLEVHERYLRIIRGAGTLTVAS